MFNSDYPFFFFFGLGLTICEKVVTSVYPSKLLPNEEERDDTWR